MNKKGFTMVELLVAMAIMGLLIIMAFPTIRAIQSNNTNTKYEEYGKASISAAKLYVDSYADDLFENGIDNQLKTISFDELTKKDLVKDINVSDSSCIKNSSITIIKHGDDYSYCLHLKCNSIGNDSNLVFNKDINQGDCSGIVNRKVIYKYGTKSKTYTVPDGESNYHVLSPSAVGASNYLNSSNLEFNGWSYNGSTFNEGSILPKISNDIVLNIVTKPKGSSGGNNSGNNKLTYKVVFAANLDGVSGKMNSITCTVGNACKLPKNSYSKDYFTFTNWVNNNNVIKDQDDIKGKFNITTNGQTIILTAVWRKNILKIGYNINGGNLVNPHSSEISLSGKTILKNKVEIFHELNYDQSLSKDGLLNYNNRNYFNSKKDNYFVFSDYEWNTEASGSGTNFSQSKVYTAKELCPSLKTNDCQLTLYLNWKEEKHPYIYHMNYRDRECVIGNDEYKNKFNNNYHGYPYRRYDYKSYTCTCSGGVQRESADITERDMHDHGYMVIFYNKTNKGVDSCKNSNGHYINQNVHTLCLNGTFNFKNENGHRYDYIHGYKWYDRDVDDSKYNKFSSGWFHSTREYNDRYKTGTDLANNAKERKKACNHACDLLYGTIDKYKQN